MPWTYTVLEIYSDDDDWPARGEPAEWIEDALVSYCQGDVDMFVGSLSLRFLLWWKIRSWLGRAWRWLSWEWRWHVHRAEIKERLRRFDEAMAKAAAENREYIEICPSKND